MKFKIDIVKSAKNILDKNVNYFFENLYSIISHNVLLLLFERSLFI